MCPWAQPQRSGIPTFTTNPITIGNPFFTYQLGIFDITLECVEHITKLNFFLSSWDGWLDWVNYLGIRGITPNVCDGSLVMLEGLIELSEVYIQ